VIGDKLVTASHDTTVKVWNINTGEIIHSLEGHTEYVMCVGVLDSGRLLSSSLTSYRVDPERFSR
jgi:WD40 repeat protein